jgi:hypothetical protein
VSVIPKNSFPLEEVAKRVEARNSGRIKMSNYSPRTPKEAIDAIQEIGQTPTLLVCGGSASRRGVSPGPTQARLDLSCLNKITRLDPNDLTCGVQAGVLIEDLEKALIPHGLAFESGPFFASLQDSSQEKKGRSIGGLLAEAPPAARSFDRGRMRSQLIGIQAVDGRGRSFKAGGRVVKNVAGYDLCKLFVGSGGAFFVGLEFQLRLIALPSYIALLRSPSMEWPEGIARWRELRETLPVPRALDLVFEGRSCQIEVLLGGSSGYVNNQIQHTGLEVVQEGLKAWRGIRSSIKLREGNNNNLFRGHCPPSQLSEWMKGPSLHGRIHYQGAFEWSRLPEGNLPPGVFAHPTQINGTQVPESPLGDPGARRIAMELKEKFGAELMPGRLSFLASTSKHCSAGELPQ